MLVSFSEYARHIKKSKGYVNKLLRQGRLNKAIVVSNDGKRFLNMEVADKLLIGCEDETDHIFESDPAKIEDQFEDSRILNCTYDEAKRIKLCLEAISEKNKILKERGQLVLIEEVKREAEKFGLLMREKLLLIPTRISDDLSCMTSIFDIKNLLAQTISETLEEISRIKVEEI